MKEINIIVSTLHTILLVMVGKLQIKEKLLIL